MLAQFNSIFSYFWAVNCYFLQAVCWWDLWTGPRPMMALKRCRAERQRPLLLLSNVFQISKARNEVTAYKFKTSFENGDQTEM